MDFQPQFYPTSNKKEIESYVYKRIDNNEEIQRLTMSLRGYLLTYNERSQSTSYQREHGIKPLMNEQGVTFVIACISIITGKSNATGNINEDLWLKLTRRVLNDILKGLVIEYKKYEIDKDKLPMLYGAVRGWNIQQSSRIKDGFEAGNTAPNIVEQITPQQPMKVM